VPKQFENQNITALQARLEELHREFGDQSGVAEAEVLLHDLAARQVELEMQNAELRASQQMLAESRDRYVNLYDLAPIGYLTFDRKGRVIELNLAAAHMLGAERSELTDQPFSIYLTADDNVRFYAHLRRVFESDLKSTVEVRLRRRNGTDMDVCLESIAVPGAGDEGARCRAAMSDITERKKVEAERQMFVSLAEQSTEFIGICDMNFMPFLVNDAGLHFVGLDSLEQAKRTPVKEFFFPEDQRFIYEEFFPRVLREGRAEVEIRFRHFKTGQPLWVLYNVFHVRDPDGNPIGLATVSRDITERKKIEEMLRDSQADLNRAQAVGQIGSWRLNVKQNELTWSAENHRIFGIPEGTSMTYETFLSVVHPDDREYVDRMWQAGLRGEPYDIEHRLIVDGEVKWVREKAELEFDKEGTLLGGFGTTQDITEQRHTQERLRQAATVFERSQEGILILNAEGRIEAANPAFSEVTGYRLPQVAGQTLRMLQSQLRDAAFYRAKWEALRSIGHWEGELWIGRSNGESFVAWTGVTAVRDDAGQLLNYVVMLADITPLKESQEQLSHLAKHDSLTGLVNRLSLAGDLDHTLRRARRHQQKLAVLYLDLDRFKVINDTLGHEAGDRLLQGVAQRLRDTVRAEDTVARLGGDEFVIVLDEIAHAEDAARLAGKVIEAVVRPIPIGSDSVRTSTSVGISIYPDNADNVGDLLKTADMAMYRAKERGRGTYCFYTPELTERALKLGVLEHELRDALERNEFVLYYQPQIALGSGKVVGLEALLRWRHPERGLLAPEAFMAAAEETGLIVPIGAWVLRSACAAAQKWRSAGLPSVTVAVNVSGRQLVRGRIVQQLRSALEAQGAQPGELALELEITESALPAMQDCVATLEDLRPLGVKLAIDDFGTGYSSLSRLKQMPVDSLKIDRSFVEDLPGNPENEAIAASIIALGQNLHMRVIAEGVQSNEQLEFLRARGCDMVQGFLCAKPLPAEEVPRILNQPFECVIPTHLLC